MIEDVYEPLAAYRDEFREKFSRLTREKFEALSAASNVDVAANREQTKKVYAIEKALRKAKGKRILLAFLMALGFVGGVVGLYISGTQENLAEETKKLIMAAGAISLVFGVLSAIFFTKAGKAVEELKARLALEKDKAWKQMESLNKLYRWDTTVKLIEATVPRLQFDSFFTAKRLSDLERVYQWDNSFNDGKSIVFAQSGVINGNPFLFGEYRKMEWGEEIYTGTLNISWRETERDSEGRSRTVTRHQTLHASLRKPIPLYSKDKVLIYGNDAAPKLTFSRKPSGFDDNDLFDGIRKKWRLSRLKAYSQNLDDESEFTLMANHEFETWFCAKDRNNEVEFRLLFTALAQTQLMALMKDLKTGFGDDFSFKKDKKLNYLSSRHLSKATLDTDPKHFHHWSYDEAAKIFQDFNEAYFKNIYFALAPILAIPLYQQTRTHEEIWKGVLKSDHSSFWEHEAIANYYGEERFKHPECTTENILKTRLVKREEGTSEIEVSAYGYKGVERTEYVDVHGGDGKWHTVPVKWVEYLPVVRNTNMYISETGENDSGKPHDFSKRKNFLRRRSIYSYIG